MTVYSDVSRVRYVANGITKEFAVPFPYLTNSDGSAQLSVYLGDSDTALVEGKDYYVEGIGSFNQEVGLNVENELDDTLKTYEERFDSGTVIFYNAPVTDQAIAILRNVPNTQGVVFINGENFPAADYANALDKLTMKVQELEEKSDRSVILPPTSKEKPIEVRENIIKAADEAKKIAETAIELVGEAPETIRQETENAKNIITEFTDEKTATFNTLAENTQNELVSYAESKTQELTEFVEEKTEEFEQTAITATEQAVGSAERSRIWAEGEQEEVDLLGGELSSKGWTKLAEEKANNAKTSADRAEKIAQEFDGVVNTIEGSIGDIGFAAFGIDETKNRRRYLNGQVISQSQFVSFTNKIKSAIELYPSLATSETNWQAEVTNSKLGQCGKFVIDDALGTIRLPKVVNINGLQDLALMGSIKAESLPNITGQYDWGTGTNSSGAFAKGAASSASGTGTDHSDWTGVLLNASLSSSTYQDNAPVQQEAIQYPYFIQVATGVEESVDVTREIELNNPFSLLDYKWSEYEITNASWLLSNGQFNSGATYISVYNLLLEIYNGTVTKDGVSVKLSTEEYTDTDFVINTADTTFRLPIKVKLASGNAVVGNGMTLGFSNSYGAIFEYGNGSQGIMSPVLGAKISAYGTLSGTGVSSADDTGYINKSIGVTTDPEKSGIETSSQDLYLYFYVGETIQDANVIAASQVLTKVANCIDRTVASDRETVVGWGMPDYSAKLELSISQGSTYIPPTDGCLAIYLGSTGSSCEITLNNSSGVRVFIETLTGENLLENKIPVIKGEKYYFNKYSGNFKNVYFFPLKGVN